ncbi:class I SAM-dependent methyltransferase [Acidobacteriota bacterium]
MTEKNILAVSEGSNQYLDRSYDTKGRFISYWHQIDEISSLKPHSVLVVGIGNRLVSDYLKQRGMNVKTVDIDPGLNPECVGDVLELPFASKTFAVIACYQVLEHLPFRSFSAALHEIFRVSKEYAVISLPDNSKVYRVFFHIPGVGLFKRLILRPQLKAAKHVVQYGHQWEIGAAGYPLKKVKQNIQKVGFRICKSYRIFEYPHHRFFILKKI